MKTRLSAVVAAALLLTGCTTANNSSSSQTPSDASVSTEQQSSSTVGNVPEDDVSQTGTDSESNKSDATSKEDNTVSEYPLAEDYYPAMPEADETAMANKALKAEISEVVKQSYFLELLKCGACDVQDSEFFGEEVPTAAPKGEGTYYEVKGVSDKQSLLALYGNSFTKKYLSELDPPLEEQLFGDIAKLYTDAGEMIKVPYYKEMDGKLLAFSRYLGVPRKPDYDGLVITSATADTVCVSMAGTCLAVDSWAIGEFILKKESGVWKTDSLEWRTAYYKGKLLSKLLNSENLSTLGMICGNLNFTSDEGLMLNDKWYCPVENFMTIDEMRKFLREIFTEEAAKLYEPYIDCFIETDGVLYRTNQSVSGSPAVFCPNPKSFGSYDLTYSVTFHAYYANNVLTETIQIPWNDGFGNTIEMRVVLVNGKIASELPCKFLNE